MPLHKIKLLVLPFLLLLLAAPLAQALSSDQALDIVGGKQGYLNQGESAKLLLATQLDLDGERYWIIYAYQTASPANKNLFFAVNDNTAGVETDEGRLSRLFAIAYRLDLLDSAKAAKASVADIEQFLADANQKRKAVSDNYLRLVKQQLELQYPDIDFAPIEAGLGDISIKSDSVGQEISDYRDFENQFQVYGTASDFDNLFGQHNKTVASFGVLSKSVEKYQNAVLQKTEETGNSARLNSSDKQNIKTVLENIYDVGDYRGFKSASIYPASRNINSLLLLQDQRVNASVSSTLFRVAKKNAENAYTNDLKASMASLLSPAGNSELKACGIDAAQLKKDWADVRFVMENPSSANRESYLAIPAKITAVRDGAAQVEGKLNDCTSVTPAPASKPKQDSGLLNILYAILALFIGYAILQQYRKWRESQQE
ncbi:hypothetical protein HY995_01060 [Candidatus Micrarchaeota archaeon]|nr:hypothetical protein [Candidatus Micrarchaeota archaeon]